MNSEVFLKYKPDRDVIFVMGAGASYPDGVPLQKHLIPLILSESNDYIRNSVIGSKVIKFLTDNFFIEKNHEEGYPRLEAVFGFLDYFITNNESLSSDYTFAILYEIKEYLIKLIHYVVDQNTDRRSLVYHRFWDSVFGYNDNISVITLNYDTLLEQAFDDYFRKRGFIDYAIHLMNDESVKGLEQYNFWVNTGKPVKVEANTNPVPIKILKLHGSLNWKYCNCCNQVLLTPWDREIDLNRGKFLGYTYPEREKYEYSCPLDKTDFNTLILPPSSVKSFTNPVIMQLFNEASREIRKVKKVVFVGYSLSHSDIHIKALFKKNLSGDSKIYIINNKNSDVLFFRYKSLSDNVEFINSPFEEVVNDEALMRKLLSPE